MVETKRNKAAIRLALSSAYSFGVAPEYVRHQNPEIEFFGDDAMQDGALSGYFLESASQISYGDMPPALR